MDLGFWVIAGIFAIVMLIMVAILLSYLADIRSPQETESNQNTLTEAYTSYDTIKQIKGYKAFSKLPIYKQLLNLKGEIDR